MTVQFSELKNAKPEERQVAAQPLKAENGIIPVILCGGVGSRLWPLSREDTPKQFLRLNSKFSLFQETVLRVKDLNIFAKPIIVGQEQHKFKIAGELEEIGIDPDVIILEPCSRNTAPAISAAALIVQQRFQGIRKLLVLPSDHAIEEGSAFINQVQQAATHSEHYLITFGIKPTNAATGYGYIKAGEALSKDECTFRVKSFVEKPGQPQAEKLLAEGNCFWNSGIFLFDSNLYLSELKQLNHKIFTDVSAAIAQSQEDFGFIKLNADASMRVDNISIDHAIFEKTTKAAVCPASMQWADLGNLNSLHAHMQDRSDAWGNVRVGENIHCFESSNNMLYAQNNLHLVMNKVDDLCVVCTQDAILITPRAHSEDTKQVYQALRAAKLDVISHTTKCHRPWGHYEVILSQINYSVKRICVLPKQQLSLQYHNHRNEHWVITKGTATITNGENTFELKENESTYIPIGQVHRIANHTDELVEFIEVQTGEKIDEKDIVRLEDQYDRVKVKV
jgi:mannose-1-phosphate guanylyltransferase/mannose-6-phosphate isomerase